MRTSARPGLWWLLGVAALAAGSYWLVYGVGGPSAALLPGRVLLAAFFGGWALAFTRPLLLVLVPLATLVWLPVSDAPGIRPAPLRWSAAAPFLGGFALTFVVTISGVPDSIVRRIYGAHGTIETIVGGLLLAWGALVAVHVPRFVTRRSAWCAAALGIATGLLLYHELDPAYDSIFFATGNGVAASHAPLTVAVFTLGLASLQLVVAAVVGRWRVPVGRVLAGVATAAFGVATVGGWLEPVRMILVR
jgi:hypothetical protein